MADSSRTIMTDAGFALETRVRADETKMQFTRATISTDDHFSDTDDALAKLTELSNIQQDGKVTAVQVINTTMVYVQVDVNQAESKADYQMRSAALYAKDDDGTEVLYGVTVLQDPVFVHKDADGSYLGFGINTTVGRASNVVVVVDPANMVTQQVFESTMKNYYTKAEVDAKFVTDDDFASKLPKNIATTDAANTFAKSQTLAGGATDGKGNAYATTKDVATGLKNGFNTKVNVSDMRKPASDVAGIEEVNALQTQVDNSAVGTNLLLNTGNLSSTSTTTYWGVLFDSSQIYDSRIKSLSGVSAMTFSFDVYIPSNANVGDNVPIQLKGQNSQATNTGDDDWNTIVAFPSYVIKQNDLGKTIRANTPVVPDTHYQSFDTALADTTTIIIRQSSNVSGFAYSKIKLEKGSVATDWCPNPDDKVNVSDMRKPANDVAGIEEVNAKQDKIGYTPADDSKVAHLSGANNFDTVPTVNTHPLLLASSLPSDLARLSQDANFTAKLQQNGQDVALANNTIARNPDTGRATDTTDFPYKGLTVDGYPIIPLVLVPDRATAITKTAQYPNYAFMYGKELS
ncbi:DUF7013 family protein [Levilactobacillus brevis]|uniref:DUF7013 family protein n=1 Tax=Levilactobacillus brevis TaxID=1580 RepID=UPI0020CBD248|nr:hypothetical protein [Levilactobacillus brevis]MCP9614884.1 hypothetical protein [Levilactobacillus brevis]